MIKLHRALMAGALLVLAAAPAQAASEVAGSLALSAGDVTTSNSDLSTLGVVVKSDDSIVLSPAQNKGYFAGISKFTSFGATELDTANLTSFSFTNTAYGTFTTTSGVIVNRTAGFLNVYLLGTFSPTGSDPLAGPASVQVTYTSAPDGTISGGFVLNAPPTGIIPEPASIAMAGIGLAAAGLVRVLRKRSV